ncbi:MAG: HDOD domain-containing protein [Gammaproteobacteria bacterium]|nr:HDOD domain-containing protein [Gammaproteobacteria bacterium]
MSAPAMDTLKPTELPAPPQEAIRLVHACTQEGVDARDLGDIICRDPTLAAELLRVANSAYFGFASEIASIPRAVTVIGQKALRNLVLCLAMRDALRAEQLPAFPVEQFWEAALRRAVCARCLASLVHLDAEACFTVGLLQDFGLLVMFHLMQHRISEWRRLHEATPDARLELEHQLFQTSHEQVGQQLARNWNLPTELGIAMGMHHAGTPENTPAATVQLCRVAECADWMAAVFSAEDKRLAVRECRRLLDEHFGIKVEQCDGLLDQVAGHMQEAAIAFGFQVGAQPEFGEVLRQANMCLLEENLSFQEMNWQLEQILRERDRVAAELARELELAREVQRSLLPAEGGETRGVVGLNLSAREVSGDFYDFYRLHTGQVAFCIADVSGKGMNAAMLMAKTSSLYRCLGKSILDPSRLLAMLNREILETSIRGMFVTMTAGIFDPESRVVRLANAGHLPSVVMHDRRLVREYPADAPPLGIVPEAEFPGVDFCLEDHSLYLYTDGLLEARLAGGRRLEREGLLELLARHSDAAPVERLQHIVAAVRGDSGVMDDDLTLLMIEG